MEDRDCGRIGESIAAGFLELVGCRIIGRNIRIGRNEIDIVASENGCIVFVEVKTRRSDRFGGARLAVGREKLLGIRRAAGRYLAENPGCRPFEESRIDVVTVDISRSRSRMVLEHLRGVV